MRFLPVLVLMSTILFAADNPFLGTWKLNTAKSKSNPMPVAQSMIVKFEADGEKVRRTATGVDGEGKPIMQGSPKGSSIAWDGKDHAVETPDGSPMTVAVKRVNDRRNDVTVKQNGKVTVTVRSVVSKDGKTMTNTVKGVNEKGEKFHQVEVLEKQ
ncbi:MAG: hypothetical protein ACRD7E_32165 [Bryobacteraceae bacterium]